MVNCGAFGCTNRAANHPELSFHKVPTNKRNPVLRKRWLHNIRRDGNLPKDSSFYICSIHFEEECFRRDLQVSCFCSFSQNLLFPTLLIIIVMW